MNTDYHFKMIILNLNLSQKQIERNGQIFGITYIVNDHSITLLNTEYAFPEYVKHVILTEQRSIVFYTNT